MPRGPAHACHRRRLWPARLRALALRSSCLLAAMPVMLPGWPGSGAAWADAAIEPVAAGAARYTPVSGVAGNLSSVGSDTMANLMALWSERFQRIYPGVNLQMQAAGSSTAPPALTQGTADIGPMSRPMTASERLAFERHHGYPPLELVVAVDAIALYVNEYNPLEGISLAQVDAMFSRSRRCGAPAAAPAALHYWSELGLSGIWQRRPIALYGRSSASGTYGYFRQRVLCGGDFRSSLNELPGSSSVAQAVAASLNGVGYAGMGYAMAGVRALPVRQAASGEYVAATVGNVQAGRYPLTRYLHIYLNRRPGKALAPVEAEFLRFVLSSSGQRLVVKEGYIPLAADMARRQLRELGP